MLGRSCPVREHDLAFEPVDEDEETWVCQNCGYASYQGIGITDPKHLRLPSGGCLLPLNLLWR